MKTEYEFYVAILDLRAAVATLQRNTIINYLIMLRVGGKLFKAISSMYKNVRGYGEKSEEVTIERDIKLGNSCFAAHKSWTKRQKYQRDNKKSKNSKYNSGKTPE